MNASSQLPLTEAIHLKISAPLFKALQRLAKKEDSSINSIAVKVLEAGVLHGENSDASSDEGYIGHFHLAASH
jgi:hypothetical protein